MKGVLSVEMEGWENGHQRGDSGENTKIKRLSESQAFFSCTFLFVVIFMALVFIGSERFGEIPDFLFRSFCYFLFWYVI